VLLKGIMKEMLDEDRRAGGNALAHDFIAQPAQVFEALRLDLEAESWANIGENSGVSRELIRQAAQIASESTHAIFCWAMGGPTYRRSHLSSAPATYLNSGRGTISCCFADDHARWLRARNLRRGRA